MRFQILGSDELRIDKEISGKYYSDQVDVIDKLYAPCLQWATHYVRDAGYFSSHVYRAMSKEILDFIPGLLTRLVEINGWMHLLVSSIEETHILPFHGDGLFDAAIFDEEAAEE